MGASRITLLYTLATCSSHKPSSLFDNSLRIPSGAPSPPLIHPHHSSPHHHHQQYHHQHHHHRYHQRHQQHCRRHSYHHHHTNTTTNTTKTTTNNTTTNTTSSNAQNCKLLVTSIQPVCCQRCCYLVLLWTKEDSENGWHSWCYFVANIFGADYFKVRWTFLNNFHHPWNLQEKHNNGHCTCESRRKRTGLAVKREISIYYLLAMWLWLGLNFRFLKCKRRWQYLPLPQDLTQSKHSTYFSFNFY